MTQKIVFTILIFNIICLISCHTVTERNKIYLDRHLNEDKVCGYLPLCSGACYPPFARRLNDINLNNLIILLNEPLAIYYDDNINILVLDIDCSLRDTGILISLKNLSNNTYIISPLHYTKGSLIDIYIDKSDVNLSDTDKISWDNIKLYKQSNTERNICSYYPSVGQPIDIPYRDNNCYHRISNISIKEQEIPPNTEISGVVWFNGKIMCSLDKIYLKFNIYKKDSALPIDLIEVKIPLELKKKWRERNMADYCYVYSKNPEECVKDFLEFLEE